MLFRLVCGPELEELWAFIDAYGPEVPREQVVRWFSQQHTPTGTPTNIEEALTVLRTLRLVSGKESLSAASIRAPFRLAVLRQMRNYALTRDAGDHGLDSWYLRLVDQLFITPDVTHLGDLHRRANRLNPPMPLNDEKLNAWRRVVEWLGLGRRVGNGFALVYSLDLVTSMLDTWGPSEGPLADFLQHVDGFLPCIAEHTDLPRALHFPLSWLDKVGRVELSYRQDAPYKAFCGTKRVNWIRKG